MIVERRINLERRVGDRRQHLVRVEQDRRRRRERRRTFDRRETPAGHVRNAIQLLEGILGAEGMSPELEAALKKAIERLWMGVREIERLAAGRYRLGMELRRIETEFELDPRD